MLIGLIAEGVSASLPPAWASTSQEQLVLSVDDESRSGSVEFTDLPFLEPAPDVPPDLPPVDTEGWPETVSGRLSWGCGPAREVEQP